MLVTVEHTNGDVSHYDATAVHYWKSKGEGPDKVHVCAGSVSVDIFDGVVVVYGEFGRIKRYVLGSARTK